MCQNRYVQNYLGSLEDLQRAEDRLEEEVGNLHHELRRVRDGLERVGGTSQALEQRARQLMSSIELCQRDLKVNRKTQEKISLQMRSSRDDDNDSLETGSES